MSSVLPSAAAPALRDAPPRPAEFDIDAATARVVKRLAGSAIERDRRGGHAAGEREAIRASGLLALTIPREFGGHGASWPVFYATLRRIAQVDSALAHLYGFHHLQIASLLLFGAHSLQQRVLRETVTQRHFWGNALNPLDKRALATPTASGWVIDGPKSFASGSIGADRLVVSAWHAGTPGLLVGILPTDRAGVTTHADWDAFGQRQTDSGTVTFAQVPLAHDEVLLLPGQLQTPQASLRTLISQLIMANLYLGIAEGAFDEARRYTLAQTRPWQASGVERAADDPYVQHRYADLWLKIRPAAAVADDAARRLQAALDEGAGLDADGRGAVAIAISEAKVLAHRAAIDVSSQMFELTGARSTSRSLGLDRFWRNARVHTLHDPIDYKLRDIGRHLLDGRNPEPTSYS